MPASTKEKKIEFIRVLKADSSQPQVLPLLNEHTSPLRPVPPTRNLPLKETSPTKNSSESTKHSLQHLSQSKSHSPEKRSSHSPQSAVPKKHSPRRRASRTPLPQECSPIIGSRESCPSNSKSYSPMKRTRRSRSSRSNKNSHLKRNSFSPQPSKSKNRSPLRTSRLRSSRSKNRSPVKRRRRSSSSRSVSRSPLRKTSRSYSSRFRSRSPSRRVSRSHSSRSKSDSPLRRIRSSHSKSCSPLKRSHRLHSSSSECLFPLNKTSSIRSYRSQSRSPLRKTSRLRTSHSKSRSPLRRHKRLRSSQSKSRSPSRRTSQSKNRSLVNRTRSKSSSPKANNSSQRWFAVRVDICTNLADDKTLKEVIFQRFVKFGFVTSVEVHHSFCGDRYVLVFYDQQHELEEALIGAPKMRLYSKKIEVTPWTGRKVGDDCDTNMWEDEMTKFSPASTRTLLIDNLFKLIAPEKLDNICVQFDDILDIDIQQEPEKSTCSALVEFCSITSLIKAAKALNKDFFGTSQVKVTFAKSRPTSCLWLDGLPSNLTLDYLMSRFSEYGPVAKTLYNCLKGTALVFYKHEKDAVAAMKELKCGLGKVSGNRVMVDFANDRTELAFCQAMETSGQNVGDFNVH